MTIMKRQRERQKAAKAARKRARRHGKLDELAEPQPTVDLKAIFGGGRRSDDDAARDSGSD